MKHFDNFSSNSLCWDDLNYDNGIYRNLHYGIIHSNSSNLIKFNLLPYVNEDKLPKKFTLIKDGDLILADTSEDRKDVAKGIEIINTNDKIISGLHTIHLREKHNETVDGYKAYYVASKSFRNFARKYCEGIKVFSIKPSLLKYAHFSYPVNKKEQEMIVNFFNNLEEKKLLIERKISILKKYKEGMVKVHSRTCIKKDLRDILSEENLKTKVNNQYEILSSTANGLFSQKEYFNHQVASENNIGYKIIKRGQLLFSPQNLWLGNINLNKEFEVGIVSPSYKIYNIDNSVNSTWLISTLKSPKLLYTYKLVSEQGASVVRRNLNLNQFLNITIVVPSNNEQIGNAISIIESKIDMLNSQLNTLEKMKVNLLNSMFI